MCHGNPRAAGEVVRSRLRAIKIGKVAKMTMPFTLAVLATLTTLLDAEYRCGLQLPNLIKNLGGHRHGRREGAWVDRGGGSSGGS
jgi:hypothetical protein